MDKDSDNYKKARQFAETAFVADLEEATPKYQKKQQELRNQMAARGAVLSGGMTRGSAELTGQHIDALLQARLNGLLEGYDLHHVPIDDELAVQTIREIIELKELKIKQAGSAISKVDAGPVTPELFTATVASECHTCPASVRLQVERRRLKPSTKPGANVTITYHLSGNNSRVNFNSTDNSVNSVHVSSTELFASLRNEITRGVEAGELRTEILERLKALEEAQNQPSFGQRYADFISVAANHMTLLAPFIPALTELLFPHLR
jgi:hypothetical protein